MRCKDWWLGLVVLLALAMLSILCFLGSGPGERYMSLPREGRKQASGKVAKATSAPYALTAVVKDVEVPCAWIHKDAESALGRASSRECQRRIAEAACANKAGKLHPRRLANLCPVRLDPALAGRYLGCYSDSFGEQLFDRALLRDNNSAEACLSLCSESGFSYAGMEYAIECFCGDDVPDDSSKASSEAECDHACPGNTTQKCGGYLTMNIYQTGLIPFRAEPSASDEERAAAAKQVPAKLVYLLTVNGRSVRQVLRLVKMVFHKDNYLLIHVDSRQDYMHRELSRLEGLFPRSVRMVRHRFVTIWGGTSQLRMLLQCMRELLELEDWRWDFVLNLSESDYPLKPASELVHFLTANKGRNFVRGHGREPSEFVRKQGLDRAFVECDDHMWLIGARQLPGGVQVDGGSDWFCLDRRFVEYALAGADETIAGLRRYFEYVAFPTETFFHMVLRNSRFCSTIVSDNLHLTNWRRSQGCKCQHKAIVDWCGCSPNDFKPGDWEKINATFGRDTFFARKFEAVVNQEVINKVDEWIMGKDFDYGLQARHDYWENLYHHHDASPVARPELLTLLIALAERHLLETLDGYELYRVLEATMYNHHDSLEGILILYEAREKSSSSAMQLEVRVSPDAYTAEAVDDHGTVHFSVGTDFDPKEVIFRNKLGAFGPQSDLAVLCRLEGGSGDPLTLVLFDPAGRAVHTEERVFPRALLEDVIKPELPKPLLPGVWSLLVLQGPYGQEEGSVLAKTRFPVTALLPESGGFSGDEVLAVNAGPGGGDGGRAGGGDYASALLAAFPPRLDLEALHRSAREGVGLLGAPLRAWVRELTREFYALRGGCLASGGPRPAPLAGTLPDCASSAGWSSRAPDPKSEVHAVDPQSGSLVR